MSIFSEMCMRQTRPFSRPGRSEHPDLSQHAVIPHPPHPPHLPESQRWLWKEMQCHYQDQVVIHGREVVSQPCYSLIASPLGSPYVVSRMQCLPFPASSMWMVCVVICWHWLMKAGLFVSWTQGSCSLTPPLSSVVSHCHATPLRPHPLRRFPFSTQKLFVLRTPSLTCRGCQAAS